MESRRTFLKKASLLAGATTLSNRWPAVIQRAFAIKADAGTTYLDAEHIVFLMQENRSFDHCYGTLRGVRGFNDPRAIRLPDGLPVWVQAGANGHRYAPFRLDIRNTCATWLGSLPHSWADMVAARNGGKMDQWLEAKKPGNKDYRHIPLTMGYYTRDDIPFYYALADAFTVCDQHFCSSLTGTSANRSYFWSGTIREEPHNPDSVAHVDNGQINYKDIGWKTYPERLQEAGVSWKVYQNELSLPVGLEGEAEDWLANFTDNNLEFYRQYRVRFHLAHQAHIRRLVDQLTRELADGRLDAATAAKKQQELTELRNYLDRFSADRFAALPEFDREIHRRAFVTNAGDPDYHRLETIRYRDKNTEKAVQVPKGDIFYQFRKDVAEGKLSMVSWLVAPRNFSDHPDAPWYGAWYVSEALDILTRHPDVWKKTIFILTYDENDGYFDHIPPFVPPLTGRPDEGAAAKDIDTAEEYVTAAQERIRTGKPEAMLDSPIGLGFRVPLVIASPWTKGGWVNSEVFDLTSPLQFLEHFLEHKTGKKIIETNISSWRRLICGNLTSVFQPAGEDTRPALQPISRDTLVGQIHAAQDKAIPGDYRPFDPEDPVLPRQEPGTKPACPLPYQLTVTTRTEGDRFTVDLLAGSDLPRTKPIGVPFRVHALAAYRPDHLPGRTWNFAVREDEPLSYTWVIQDFADGHYALELHGPNGFYGVFAGDAGDPPVTVNVRPDVRTGGLYVSCAATLSLEVTVADRSYGREASRLQTDGSEEIRLDLSASKGWYDIELRISGYPRFGQRFAGHVETGKPGITDPLMGGVLPVY